MIAHLVLLSTAMCVTSYQPTPAQTRPECIDRHHCDTSIGDGITKFGVAASQDLLKSGRVRYGDVLYVPGFGYRIVNDSMGAVRHEGGKVLPITNQIDLMVFSREAERRVGVRYMSVYKVGVMK